MNTPTMSDNTPQQQPRKEISAEEFIKIWKGDYKGVEGYEEFYPKRWNNETVVVFNGYKVIGDIQINRLKKLPNIELRNTETDSFRILDNSTSGSFDMRNSTFGSFDIRNSTSGFFEIWNSTIGDFVINDSTTDHFSIRENSTIDFIEIINSITGFFEINKSRTGFISILKNSITSFFLIVGNATTDFFEIQNSTTGYFHILDNSTTGYFHILDNSTTGDFHILYNSITGDFHIRDNSITGDYRIEESTTGNYKIEGSTIGNVCIFYNSNTGYFSIDHSTTGYFLSQINSTFDSFFINNSTTSSFNIVDNTTIDLIEIKNSTVGIINIRNSIASNFTIENSIIGFIEIKNATTGDFYILDNSTIDNFRILDNSIIKNITANNVSLENIIIEDVVYINLLKLIFLNGASKTLTIKSSTISFLTLELDIAYQITINGKMGVHTQVHTLDFKETILTKDAYIHISDTDVNQMNIDYFLNHGVVVFNNITSVEEVKRIIKDERGNAIVYKEGGQKGEYQFKQVQRESVLSLVNSDLGNTQFIGCDLASFDRFEFKNSKIADVFLADTTLPHRNKITTTDGANENEQRRLALSQFKKIYERQGDMVRAAEFRAEEMEVYREQLKKDKNAKNRNTELFNLWMNRYSNYYGSNWLQAVFVTLALNWLLYTGYCLNKGYDINVHVGMENFYKLFSHSFAFLNPIHKADFLDEVTKVDTNWSRWIDYISRIVMAYMVYQTVAAFRKFGRKSA